MFAVVMLLACGGLLYYGFKQVSGEGEISLEIDQIFQEIAQGHSAEVYRTRTSPELRQVTSEEQFVTFCQMLNEQLGPLRSKTVSGFFVRQENLASVVEASYKAEFQRGDGTIRTGFRRENDRWLLRAFFVESPQLTVATRADCPNCGQSYEVGAKFCPHCGKELAPAAAEPSEHVEPTERAESPAEKAESSEDAESPLEE